ncbi:MAG TPA: hypothetical protein VF908_09950 [Gemmatimonadaceae bacterium]
MLESVRGMMIGLSVASWILATIFVVTVLRVTLRAEIRGRFRRIAHVHGLGAAHHGVHGGPD